MQEIVDTWELPSSPPLMAPWSDARTGAMSECIERAKNILKNIKINELRQESEDA